jgi:hypothetical protein
MLFVWVQSFHKLGTVQLTIQVELPSVRAPCPAKNVRGDAWRSQLPGVHHLLAVVIKPGP